MTDSIIPRPAQNDNSLLGDPSDAMRDIFENTLREVSVASSSSNPAFRYTASPTHLSRHELRTEQSVGFDPNRLGSRISFTSVRASK